MFDAFLRALKDRLLGPLALRWFGWVHPNVLSVAAFAFGLGTAALAAIGRYDAALWCWIVNRLLDGLDGTVARVHLRQSDFGGYLDILLDFAVYAAIPVGLAVGAASRSVALAAAFLEATFLVNAASWMYLSAILERRGAGVQATGERTTITMPPAIVAGAETVVFYSLFLLLPEWLVPMFGVMGVLVLAGSAQRLWWARRSL